VKSLDIMLGGITTSIVVASEAPPLWSRAGGEPRRPGQVIGDLFAEARADGVAETSIMAARVRYFDDGAQVEPPMAILSWLILSR
jgi:hypothetical protein